MQNLHGVFRVIEEEIILFRFRCGFGSTLPQLLSLFVFLFCFMLFLWCVIILLGRTERSFDGRLWLPKWNSSHYWLLSKRKHGHQNISRKEEGSQCSWIMWFEHRTFCLIGSIDTSGTCVQYPLFASFIFFPHVKLAAAPPHHLTLNATYERQTASVM